MTSRLGPFKFELVCTKPSVLGLVILKADVNLANVVSSAQFPFNSNKKKSSADLLPHSLYSSAAC